MASTSNASNWQQREEEAVKKLRESLPQWTGSLDDDAPLPRGTKTQTGVLPESGLTYYWRKNDEPRDRVELVIAVRAGSIDETDDERGLAHVLDCVEINQCVGCTRQFFTKSFLGDDVAVLARSSGEELASPRHRAGVASMAWRTMR